MAELSTLARPYAKAVFNTALESEKLNEWSVSLLNLTMVSENSDIVELIANPAVSAETKKTVITDVLTDSLDEGVSNLIDVLAENHRLALLAEISRQFEDLKAEYEKTASVTITSAFNLTDSQQQVLKEKLSAKFGRQVSIDVEIDASLLGGVIIKAGDTVIDGSVSGKLAKLADAMNS